MNNFNQNVEHKSTDELLEIVYQFDQWSPDMLKAVEGELSKRNSLPTDIITRRQQIAALEEVQLSKGQEASLLWEIIGWLTVLGIFGIFVGYHHSFSKVSSKYTDKQYFRYNSASRKNGLFLFYTSICAFVAILLYKLMTTYGGSGF